jgi:hypothetical protein
MLSVHLSAAISITPASNQLWALGRSFIVYRYWLIPKFRTDVFPPSSWWHIYGRYRSDYEVETSAIEFRILCSYWLGKRSNPVNGSTWPKPFQIHPYNWPLPLLIFSISTVIQLIHHEDKRSTFLRNIRITYTYRPVQRNLLLHRGHLKNAPNPAQAAN